jgi:2-keto-3-deoxy-6-phosphogluconate aldolase
VLVVLSAGDADHLSRMVLASYKNGMEPIEVTGLQEEKTDSDGKEM